MYRMLANQLTPPGMLVALLAFTASACGVEEERQDPGTRPLPDEQESLRPGEYRSKHFETLLTFRVGEDCRNVPPEVYDDLRLTRGETGGLGFANLEGARFYKRIRTGTPYGLKVPEDIVGWLQKRPFLETGRPEPVEVGRVGGTRLDVVVEDLPDDHSGVCGLDCVDFFRLSSCGPPLAFWEGGKLRIIVLCDANGEKVNLGSGNPETEFDEHAQEARKVLYSLEWRG